MSAFLLIGRRDADHSIFKPAGRSAKNSQDMQASHYPIVAANTPGRKRVVGLMKFGCFHPDPLRMYFFLVSTLCFSLKSHATLQAEIFALRDQNAVLRQASQKRFQFQQME
jgi:hypothetical protein